MPRKKPPKDPQAEVDAICKLLCDEARNHMKVRNYIKALSVYNKVRGWFWGDFTTMTKARDILGTDRDNEFLQSFVRVGIQADEEDNAYKSVYMQSKQDAKKPDLAKQPSEGKSEGTTPRRSRASPAPEIQTKKKRRSRIYFDEVYTDKDRAAAVSHGSYDIKQSLSIKRRQDRSEALQLPDDSDPGALYELGFREYKNGNTDTAILFISKALELNPGDQNALVTRSKCYLLLGEPTKGLQDAEEALTIDKGNIRAIYQKAEALYFLGEFEHSLMFFHRGLQLRPELNSFRLGVQKSQEAIEQTIGGYTKKSGSSTRATTALNSAKPPSEHTSVLMSAKTKSAADIIKPAKLVSRPRTSKSTAEKRESKKLLGELCVDKEYLENLLKHPSLKRADTETEHISVLAKDAVQFLNKRQEFWRQQRPCTTLPKQAKQMIETPFPKWY